MVKLVLVVTRIGDCNEDIMQRLHILTHNIPGDKDIQLQLHQITVIHISSIHVYSQVTTHNGD